MNSFPTATVAAPSLVPLFAALIGAIAAGVLQTGIGIWTRWLERSATLVALASEVHTLCALIRDQRYLEELETILELANAATIAGPGIVIGDWDGETLKLDVRSNYFEVFSANAGKLGMLKPRHVRDIVRFYGLCKTAVDSLRPDGPHQTMEERRHALRDQVAVFRAILLLGDRIIKFPKAKLFEDTETLRLAH